MVCFAHIFTFYRSQIFSDPRFPSAHARVHTNAYEYSSLFEQTLFGLPSVTSQQISL